jgi:hypothetical protein
MRWIRWIRREHSGVPLGAMDSQYEIEPERIGRSGGGHRPLVAIFIGLVVVAVMVSKPWDGPDARSHAVRPTTAAGVAAATPAGPRVAPGLDSRPVAAAPAAVPGWPAAPSPTVLATQTAQEAERAVASIARHAGTWGVGNAGVGPRMLRDEPWSDWTAVTIELADGSPLHVGQWPGTDLCAGFPTIYDRPTLVAITTPREVSPDWKVEAWWADGRTAAALHGSVVQISPAGRTGITYLERVDQAAWPPGRYEFHVVTASAEVSLTVCLTRRS